MKKKMDNKGFSLVELIIVIAIMVILVAVLAPQYLRYVEKSRISSDTQTAVELINLMQVLASDPEVSLTKDTAVVPATYVATGASTGKVTISSALKTELENNGLMDTNAINNIQFQSTAYKDANVVIGLRYDDINNMWTVYTSGVDSSGRISTSSTPSGS